MILNKLTMPSLQKQSNWYSFIIFLFLFFFQLWVFFSFELREFVIFFGRFHQGYLIWGVLQPDLVKVLEPI